MSRAGEARLWLAQRISAGILGVAVVVHLGTIIYAAHVGFSAAAIISRLHDNLLFATFYFVFVAAAAVHAPIGLRAVIAEMTAWRGRSLNVAAVAFALLLFALGAHAVLLLTAGV